jgi:hypothetical protein
MTQANGEAKVEAKQGKTNIEITIKSLEQPSKLGAELLTYVVWIVTPEGRTGNLGELLVNKNGEAKLSATTPAQTFSMIVTAEPYFAVRLPSEIVVVESETRKNTKGKLFPVNEYKLMKRNQYEKLGNPLAMTPDLERVPLELYEARNAVDIAKSRGAEADAPEIFSKAKGSLESAENALARKADKKEIISTSPANCTVCRRRARCCATPGGTTHSVRARRRSCPPGRSRSSGCSRRGRSKAQGGS